MNDPKQYVERELGKERKTAKAFYDLTFRVKKLRPHTGDLVVISHDDQNFDNAQAVAKSIGAELESQGRRVLLLVLGPGITIDTLDEVAMRKAGWARMSPELREAEEAIAQLQEDEAEQQSFVADGVYGTLTPPVLAK